LIPESNLNIIAYNRTVNGLNDLSVSDFLTKLSEKFELKEQLDAYTPNEIHNFSMYLEGKWYSLTCKKGSFDTKNVVECLDAQILTKNILTPILGIENVKNDNRLSFIPGTKGNKGLKDKVDNEEATVAFGLYPVIV